MIVHKIKSIIWVLCFLMVCPVVYAGNNEIKPAQAVTEEPHPDLLMDELYGDSDTGDMDIHIPDPLYPFNYLMYSFNDGLYFWVLKPVATGYKKVMPPPVRTGIQNFFHNLLSPVRLVNNLLQGKVQSAGTEVEIFFLNSTIGLLGFMTPAQDHFDLETSDEDFGQTLGAYRIGEGFYLVLPFFGPSSLRDTVGLVGDSFLKPVNYIESDRWRIGLTAVDTVNKTSFALGNYEALKQSALDPYQSLKSAYIQNRRYKISR